MNGRANIWRKIVAAAIVATGIGVVWGVGCGWLFSIFGSLSARTIISEQLDVAYDGTPVISIRSNDTPGMSTLGRRTLDGKPWPSDYELWLYGASPRRFELPPGVIRLPIRWDNYRGRIGGVTDGKKPPTAWYVVSSDKQADHLYFAGFDPTSKLSVGYIGSEGFRLSLPPRKEQFSFAGNEAGRVTDRVASSQYVEGNSIVQYHNLSAYDHPAQWLIFVVDGKRLWEIDLRERTSRVVLEVPDSLSIGEMHVLEATVQDADRDDNARRTRPGRFRLVAQQDVFRALPPAADPADSDTEPPKTTGIVVVRTRDRVLLYDATSDNHWEFKLPSQVPADRSFTCYWLSPDTLLLNCHAGYWSGGSINELYWISPDGAIQREERVELQGSVPPLESREFWAMSALMPEPLGWLGSIVGVEPFWRLQYYKANTYSAALRQTFALLWPMSVIVLIVSLASAWYAHRLHRQYFRPHSGVWATFVFLFGPPGLAAYWLEHRRAKLEPCGECGANVPRDREACAACATPFPAPPLVGTEIFA